MAISTQERGGSDAARCYPCGVILEVPITSVLFEYDELEFF
jgi:hypothetical protein